MRAVKTALIRAVHVIVFSVALHIGHALTSVGHAIGSDRALDAMTDVGLDKAADFGLHVLKVGE